MRNLLYAVLLVLAGLLLSFPMNRLYKANYGPADTILVSESTTHTSDTVWMVDTYKVSVPKIIYSTSDESRRAIVIDTIEELNDTVSYDLLVYKDSTYTAWVSGFCVKLDSIETYPRTMLVHDSTYVEKIVKVNGKQKKWNIGLTGGYGVGKSGLTPYIGIGVTYSLFGF